ncbi:hypothetical protein ACDW_22880 [Acidovorax sp. DW039]|uniref:hypothetical protein n=1 Tax=Acidovorax sp. DW039 TaxID=3095606 RepID=UPI00308A7425|nr:hypothetical protein ACDW_22880 [Acidovorax sp. DW039]
MSKHLDTNQRGGRPVGSPNKPKKASAPLPNLALPPQINVMHGPVYRPEPSPVLRPGALDYQRIASRGYRC